MTDVAEMIPKINELSTYNLWTPQRPGLFYRLPEGNFMQSEPDEHNANFNLLWSSDCTAQTAVNALLGLLEKEEALGGSGDGLKFEWDPPRRKMKDDTVEHASIIIECSPLDTRRKLEQIIGATGTREVTWATGRILDAFSAHTPSLRQT